MKNLCKGLGLVLFIPGSFWMMTRLPEVFLWEQWTTVIGAYLIGLSMSNFKFPRIRWR